MKAVNRTEKTHSLARDVLLQMALRISIVVILVSGLSYWHIVSTLQEQTLDSLSKYITERGHKESAIFELAEDNHRVFKERFVDAYKNQSNVSDEKFWSIFKPWDDGTTHLQKRAFDGYRHPDGTISHSTTAYIGPKAPIESQEFRNRLYLAYNLVDRFSDAWTNRFANLYISMPENVNIVHWPGLAWANNAEATLDVTTEEWVYITTQENNPKRESAWTGLYFDPTANEWMVSCETPIDVDGKHLLSAGHDILLNKLFERVFNDHLAGTYNFIIRADGRLIAHPDKVDQIQEKLGLLDVQSLDDPMLINMYQQIRDEVILNDIDTKVIDNALSDNLLAVTKIHGPDWRFVTVYPKSLLTSTAERAAEFILILGVLSLLVELLMIYLLMQKKILSPLRLFNDALKHIDDGEYHEVAQGKTPLPEKHNNEIGALARTLRGMALSIENYSNRMEGNATLLESMVTERTSELNRAKSVAEQQARIDELTGIPNRRYFNEIAKKELSQAERRGTSMAFCIIDIDLFKLVNDLHGHTTGDVVLQSVAKILSHSVRDGDFLARIGGEEFAVLFSDTPVAESLVVVERIRTAVADAAIEVSGRTLQLTISAGISGGTDSYDFDTLYAEADNALYNAKEKGRNCTVVVD